MIESKQETGSGGSLEPEQPRVRIFGQGIDIFIYLDDELDLDIAVQAMRMAMKRYENKLAAEDVK